MPKVTLGQWTAKDQQFVRNLKAELSENDVLDFLFKDRR